MSVSIDIDNVVKKYENTTVINGLSLKIHPGEFFKGRRHRNQYDSRQQTEHGNGISELRNLSPYVCGR